MSADSPAAVLVNGAGVEVGTATDPLRVDPTGTTTQPVSAAALPLPAGAATEATLATRATEATLATRATAAAQTDGSQQAQIVQGGNTATVTGANALKVDGSAVTQPVSGTVTSNQGTPGGIAAPWPTILSDGAAPLGTIANPLHVDLASGDTAIVEQGTAAPLAGAWPVKITDGVTPAVVTGAGAVKVDGSAVTQPVSAVSLPLPTGAATSANQVTPGTQTTQINDGTNTAAVKAASTPAVAVDPALVVAVSPNNSIAITAAALPLPAGAATEATLATRASEATLLSVETNTDNLDVALSTRASEATLATRATEATLATRLADATFTSRINTLGQKAMAASTPVVIASDQTVIPVSDNGGSLTVDTPQLPAALVGGRLDSNVGAWLGSTAPTVGQKTMADSVPVVISSDQTEVPVAQGTAAATAGAWPTKVTDGTNVQAVKAASTAAVAADPSAVVALSPNSPLPAGTNNIGDVDVLTVPAPLSTTGGGTEATALRVTVANDSTGLLSVDDNGGSLTVDTPQLPGALVGGRLDANVGAWLGSTAPTVGQKAMAASVPVVVSSDQTNLPVNLTQVGGAAVVTGGTAGSQGVGGLAADGAAPAGNPVLVAGQDGTNVQSLFTDTTGRQRVVGAAASGVAVAGDPVRVAGSDGATTRDLLTDAGGRPVVVGAAADGAAPVSNPVLIAGQDGTNVQSLLTDTSGRARAVGAAASGAAVDGDPVRVAGSDGTTTRDVLTDTGGRQIVVGAAADGAAPVSNPVLIAAQDGANVQSLLSDMSGRPRVVGAAASGAAVVGDPVRIAGSDGATTRDVLTDAGGRPIVVGAAADGAAPVSNPVLVAGQDGTNTQSLFTDTTGRQRVVGAAASGVAVAGDPVRIGGSDGTDTRDILTDTGGRQVVVGAAADGAAPVSNPVLIAAQDGTNVQSLLSDTSGRPMVVGAAADGAAVAGNPVLVGGQDGTNAQSLLTDTGGRPRIVGAAATGAAKVSDPVVVAGIDGSGNVRDQQLRNAQPDGTEYGQLVRPIEVVYPTYYAVYDRIVPAANKYMATLFNTSASRKVVIQRVWNYNWQVTGVADNLLDQEFRRITARTAGTAVTIDPTDDADTLSAGITADTNSTAVTDGNIIQRLITGSAETTIAGGEAGLKVMRTIASLALIYERKQGTKGITLRENKGVSIKNISAVAVGTVSYIIEFTDEPA